ncbi:MAG: hypothetical protein IJC70_03080, partial [Firmicutes bacterium]|nr:hypothetical protein [Bacillota bacterium]
MSKENNPSAPSGHLPLPKGGFDAKLYVAFAGGKLLEFITLKPHIASYFALFCIQHRQMGVLKWTSKLAK